MTVRRLQVLRAPCPNHGPQPFERDELRCLYRCPEGDAVVTDEAIWRNPDGGDVEVWWHPTTGEFVRPWPPPGLPAGLS